MLALAAASPSFAPARLARRLAFALYERDALRRVGRVTGTIAPDPDGGGPARLPGGPQHLRCGRAAGEGRERRARRLAERGGGAGGLDRVHHRSARVDTAMTRSAARLARRRARRRPARPAVAHPIQLRPRPARMHGGADEPGRLRRAAARAPARSARKAATAPTGSPATSTTRPASACSCARASAPRVEAAEAT